MVAKTTLNIVGYIAAGCLSFVLVPQVIHTYRTRSVVDVSLAFLVLETLASAAFIAYGAMLPSGDGLPVLVSNGIACACAILLLFAKCTFGKHKADDADVEAGYGGDAAYAPLDGFVSRTPYGSVDSRGTTDEA